MKVSPVTRAYEFHCLGILGDLEVVCWIDMYLRIAGLDMHGTWQDVHVHASLQLTFSVSLGAAVVMLQACWNVFIMKVIVVKWLWCW
jgi:hypothetical protein